MNPEDMAALHAVALACKAAVALAGMAGLPVVEGSPSLRFDFDPSGDITVTLLVDGEEMDSGVVSAADIETFLSEDDLEEAEGPEAPAEAGEPQAQ